MLAHPLAGGDCGHVFFNISEPISLSINGIMTVPLPQSHYEDKMSECTCSVSSD